MSTESCSSTSLISRNVVISYGTFYGLLLIAVSIYSFQTLNKDGSFSKISNWKQFKRWILDLKKRRNCYIPIIAHLFDQITDVSVAIQFYEIATDDTKSANNWELCNGLNIWYLFVLTILTMLIYRVITAYLIYNYTHKSCTRLVSQLIDLELFRSLYINYLCNKIEPCDPQRWITAMEAALESTPQSLIQLIYLVKTDAFDMSNILIIISLLSSLWSIISKLIQDDKAVVCQQAKRLNFRMKLHSFLDIIIGLATIILAVIFSLICFPIVLVCSFTKVNMSGYDGEFGVDDIGNHHAFDVKILRKRDKQEMTIYTRDKQVITIFNEDDYEMIQGNKQYNFYTIDLNTDDRKWIIFYNNYDLFFNGKFSINSFKQFVNVFLIDQFKSPRSFSWLYVLRVIWRMLDVTSRLFIMVLIWSVMGGYYLGAMTGIEGIVILCICIKTKHWEFIIGIVTAAISLTDVTKRISGIICWYRIISNFVVMALITVWLYIEFECPKCTDFVKREELSKSVTIFSLFVYCWFSIILSPLLLNLLFAYEIFIDGATQSRDLEQMIEARNYDGILEIQLYAEEYGIYNQKTQKKLLALAIEQQKQAAIRYLLKKKDETILPQNILSFYSQLNTKNAKTLVLRPEIIHIKNVENDNNILDMYDTYSHSSNIAVLLDIYQKYPYLTDKKGRNAFDIFVYHYSQNSALLSTNDLINIGKKQPKLMNELFFCAVAANNKQFFLETNEINDEKTENVTAFKDFKNQGIYHYCGLDGFQNWNHFFPDFDEYSTQIFKYKSDFDTNGVLYYLGSKMHTDSYSNPADIGLVSISDRSGSNPKLIHSVVGRGQSEYYDFGDNKNAPFIKISLPIMIKLAHYSLKHYVKFAKLHETIRNWKLQGSQNGNIWKTISEHKQDYSLDKNKGTFTWDVSTNSYFSYFRLLLTKSKSQSSINLILRCSGIEFYGETMRLDPLLFYQKYPECLEHNGKSPFFEACQTGDIENINKLIMEYPQLLDRKDEWNENVLDYYMRNDKLFDDEMIRNIYQMRPGLMDKNRFNIKGEKCETEQAIDQTNMVGDITQKKQIVSNTKSQYQLIQLTQSHR